MLKTSVARLFPFGEYCLSRAACIGGQPLEDTCSTSAAALACQLDTRRWATKKAGGTADQKRDSAGRRLGVKMSAGQIIFPGQIIIRQRGTKYRPGYNVGIGRDHTIYATSVGTVKFTDEGVKMGDKVKEKKFVSVVPLNNDWSPEYKEVEKQLVERRALIKRQILRDHPIEPALYFPLASKEKPFRWIGPVANVLPTNKVAGKS